MKLHNNHCSHSFNTHLQNLSYNKDTFKNHLITYYPELAKQDKWKSHINNFCSHFNIPIKLFKHNNFETGIFRSDLLWADLALLLLRSFKFHPYYDRIVNWDKKTIDPSPITLEALSNYHTSLLKEIKNLPLHISFLITSHPNYDYVNTIWTDENLIFTFIDSLSRMNVDLLNTLASQGNTLDPIQSQHPLYLLPHSNSIENIASNLNLETILIDVLKYLLMLGSEQDSYFRGTSFLSDLEGANLDTTDINQLNFWREKYFDFMHKHFSTSSPSIPQATLDTPYISHADYENILKQLFVDLFCQICLYGSNATYAKSYKYNMNITK